MVGNAMVGNSMVGEAEADVLHHLRQIATQLEVFERQFDALQTRLDSHDKRWEEQSQRWGEMRGYLNQALSTGMINQLKNDEQDARLSELEIKAKRIEDLHSDLRRWVTRLDEQR